MWDTSDEADPARWAAFRARVDKRKNEDTGGDDLCKREPSMLAVIGMLVGDSFVPNGCDSWSPSGAPGMLGELQLEGIEGVRVSKGAPTLPALLIFGKGLPMCLGRIPQYVPVITGQQDHPFFARGGLEEASEWLDGSSEIVAIHLIAALQVFVNGVDHHPNYASCAGDGFGDFGVNF